MHEAVSGILNSSEVTANSFCTDSYEIVEILYAEEDLVELLHV